MENNQAGKSQAELYREERKKRMAAAAKKTAKKNPKADAAKKIIGKIVAAVLSVAVILGALYAVLNFFGVPQKVLTATKVGTERVSVAKYSFYYMDMYMNIQNTSSAYDSQYGEGAGKLYTGYDSTKTPMEQEYTLGELEGFEGENPTWADYLRINTLQYLQSYVAYAKMARDAGLTLTEDEIKEIDEQIESFRETAEKSDFSLDRFLTKYYGKGASEKLLREVFEEKALAGKYARQKNEDVTNAVTAEQIAAEYDANPGNYALMSVSAFTVTADTSGIAADATDEEKEAAKKTAMDEAKTKAEGYAANVTNAETMLAQAKANSSTATETSIARNDVTASSLETSFGAAAKEWVLASDRAVGDVTVVESTNGYTVLYMSVLPHKDLTKPVDVRHILVQFKTTTDNDGNTVKLSDKEKEEYMEKTQEIYNKFKADPTEENFAALANENSADGGSNTNGGLYENVKVGDMVTEFNDWCFDPARKPGDTGIVETTYGYHIMYYVGNDHEETWYTTVRDSLANTQLTEFDTEIQEGETYKVKERKLAVNWTVSQLENLIKLQYVTR